MMLTTLRYARECGADMPVWQRIRLQVRDAILEDNKVPSGDVLQQLGNLYSYPKLAQAELRRVQTGRGQRGEFANARRWVYNAYDAPSAVALFFAMREREWIFDEEGIVSGLFAGSACAHTRTHARSHTYTHKRTHTHIHTHTHTTHTHTHTCLLFACAVCLVFVLGICECLCVCVYVFMPRQQADFALPISILRELLSAHWKVRN